MMHPAKQIFVQISLILQISELDCYTLYLDTALDFRLDFSVLADQSKTDESLAEQLYGDKNKPPRFFNYLSYSDWSRLSNNLLPSNEGLCFYLESIPFLEGGNFNFGLDHVTLKFVITEN